MLNLVKTKCTAVHHIEMGVRNGRSVLQQLTEKFKFHLVATRDTSSSKQWVVQSGNQRFLITELNKYTSVNQNLDSNRSEFTKDEYLTDWNLRYGTNSISKVENIDSVFNIALEVKNVPRQVARIIENGGYVIREPKTVWDDNGHIEYATIRSCVGNVIHTFIDSSLYRGNFLPGFISTNQTAQPCCIKPLTSHFDHVTFAVPEGFSTSILEWYEKCFGMKRFPINSDEDKDTGFLVMGEDTGMRLMAMEYWRCAELGLNMTSDDNSFKFVIAEPLPGQGSNQVDTFLSSHKGPGIQHIGLHTDDIGQCVHEMRSSGVDFIQPPAIYYTEVGKLEEIQEVGEDIEQLRRQGILLDSEADGHNNHNTKRYLKQMFTQPIFDKDTFFLEVIQRCGATGFGAGNIRALWRSVQVFMDQRMTNNDDVGIDSDTRNNTKYGDTETKTNELNKKQSITS